MIKLYCEVRRRYVGYSKLSLNGSEAVAQNCFLRQSLLSKVKLIMQLKQDSTPAVFLGISQNNPEYSTQRVPLLNNELMDEIHFRFQFLTEMLL